MTPERLTDFVDDDIKNEVHFNFFVVPFMPVSFGWMSMKTLSYAYGGEVVCRKFPFRLNLLQDRAVK